MLQQPWLLIVAASEHGYLRAGHVTDATGPVEALATSLSLEYTLGPLK